MEMTEIRRTELHTLEQLVESATSTTNPLAELAATAAELLGYKRLSDALSKQTIAAVAVEYETPLRAALRELDMSVLDVQDVSLYQKERQVEQTGENFEKWRVDFMADDSPRRWWQNFSGAGWVLQKIAEYKQPIPEFVLAKAVQIKQRIPECEIFVESLQDHPDPFLVVAVGKQEYQNEKPKEHYYVEVWAEPKFEGRI